MRITKFFKSLQFRLIAIVLVIFLAANVIIVKTSLSLSSKSTSDTVEHLLDAVVEEVLLHVLYRLAGIFRPCDLGHKQVGLAFALMLEIIHEALLLKHLQIGGYCGVGRFGVRPAFDDVPCACRMTDIP